MKKIDQQIMKDNNFLEMEKFLFLYPEDIEKLNQSAINASKLLCDLELMDYSLLVFKLRLNANEVL